MVVIRFLNSHGPNMFYTSYLLSGDGIYLQFMYFCNFHLTTWEIDKLIKVISLQGDRNGQ